MTEDTYADLVNLLVESINRAVTDGDDPLAGLAEAEKIILIAKAVFDPAQ